MKIEAFLKKFNRSIKEIKIIKQEDALKAVESDGDALQYVDISIFDK